MDITKNNNQIFYFLILYFFLPRLNIERSNHLVHLVLGMYMLLITLINLKQNKVDLIQIIKKSSSLKVIISFGVLFTITMVISIIFKDSISISNVLNSFKMVFFILITFFSLSVTLNKPWSDIKEQLIRSSKVFIVFQSCISLLQLLNLNFLDNIYVSTKSFPLGSLVRVTGTLNNPNLLAWFTLQFLVLIILFEKNKVNLMLFSFLSLVLIVFSGSRSMLLITPLSLLLTIILNISKNGINKKTIIKVLLIFSLFLITTIIMLYMFRSNVPYLAQLFDVFSGRNFRNIASFNKRFEIWGNAFRQLKDGGIVSIVFGLASRSYEAVDNDYIYAVLRFGLIGFILNASIISVMAWKLIQKGSEIRIFAIQYFLFAFIIGIQAETFIGWIYPIILYMLYGIEIAREQRSTIK